MITNIFDADAGLESAPSAGQPWGRALRPDLARRLLILRLNRAIVPLDNCDRLREAVVKVLPDTYRVEVKWDEDDGSYLLITATDRIWGGTRFRPRPGRFTQRYIDEIAEAFRKRHPL